MVIIFYYFPSLNLIQPDICAQGTEIYVPSVKANSRDEYTINNGTSLSCPIVAGKVALIKREFEQKSLNNLDLSAALIRSAIMTTGREILFFCFFFHHLKKQLSYTFFVIF